MHDTLLHEPRADRREQGDHERARAQYQACIDGAISVERLQDLRDHRGGAEDAEAEDEQEHSRDGEVTAFQQTQVDDGIFLPQLPEDCRGPADERNAECRGDEAAAEPVVDLAAIEKDFKCSRAEANERMPVVSIFKRPPARAALRSAVNAAGPVPGGCSDRGRASRSEY